MGTAPRGELFKYQQLLIDFYFGTGSEVIGSTIESTAEKIIILCFTEKALIQRCVLKKRQVRRQVFSEHSIVPMERYTLCLVLVSK